MHTMYTKKIKKTMLGKKAQICQETALEVSRSKDKLFLFRGCENTPTFDKDKMTSIGGKGEAMINVVYLFHIISATICRFQITPQQISVHTLTSFKLKMENKPSTAIKQLAIKNFKTQFVVPQKSKLKISIQSSSLLSVSQAISRKLVYEANFILFSKIYY